MGKLISVLAAAAGVSAFAYLTAPAPSDQKSTIAESSHVPASSRASPTTSIAPPATASRFAVDRPNAAPRTKRASVARDLEIELARLGCYAGPRDGAWSEEAQRAMRAVTNKAVARLPVAEPDYILLSLARQISGQVCSRPCAPGSETNSCLVRADGPTTTTALIPTAGSGAPPIAGATKTSDRGTADRPAKRSTASVSEVAMILQAQREAERLALTERRRRLAATQAAMQNPAIKQQVLAAEQQRAAELAILEARRRQEALAPSAASAPRPVLPEGRMALGAARLPTETADGPAQSVATSPQPGSVIPSTVPPGVAPLPPVTGAQPKAAARARHREAAVAPVPRPAPRNRKAWTRTVFDDMKRNGP